MSRVSGVEVTLDMRWFFFPFFFGLLEWFAHYFGWLEWVSHYLGWLEWVSHYFSNVHFNFYAACVLFFFFPSLISVYWL